MEIVGTDSRNNEHMLPFMNGEVIVPPYITSINIAVSFPSLFKTEQNLYSYSFGSSDGAESFTKKAGENITISKIGYSNKILKIQSAGPGKIQSTN